MAIENKWKSSQSDSSEMDSIESQILEAENDLESHSIGVRSDWTMQRKMGVAMALVGVILVVVGVAPMVLDSDTLKGSLAESQEEAPDPLAALFGGGDTATTAPAEAGTSPTVPENSQFADNTSDVGTTLPVETVSFGGTEDTSIEMEDQPTTVNVAVSENTGTYSSASVNLGGSADTSITSEIDRIIAEEDIIENGGTPVNLSNSNTGITDTLGSEFMTENPNASSSVSSSNEGLHASAGLQNTTVKKTKLTNSGPADMALIMFLLSLFIVGGVRYRKELF